MAGGNRLVSEIDLGVTRQSFPGSADFQLWFYANNGPGGGPGTLLWNSGLLSDVVLSGPVQTLAFSVPLILVPDTFTWESQISNSQGSVTAVVEQTDASAPTQGTFVKGWFGSAGSWTGEQTQLQARVVAVPEPSLFALLGVGAIGLLGYARRRRRHARPDRCRSKKCWPRMEHR